MIDRASRATDAEAFVRQSQNSIIDLQPLLSEQLISFQQTYSGIYFDFQGATQSPVYVNADPTLIKEAISNLLANAASYANEESVVSLSIDVNGTNAVIKVSNKGPVIEGDTELLFSPFASSRSSLSSEHQGLGLYLVRLIAEHHGGTATISNQDDGSGVQASLLLPLAIQAMD